MKHLWVSFAVNIAAKLVSYFANRFSKSKEAGSLPEAKPAQTPPPPVPAPTPVVDETKGTVVQLIPQWYRIAEGELGVKEKANGDNGRILEYHSKTTLSAKTDATAWCSAFVCWCLEKAGVEHTRSAWARSYLSWGVALKKPRVGCVCVFSRGDGGHVGFYVSETADDILVLGGNQSDSVCRAYYSKTRLLGYRWPTP